jgi:hypothetical protein
MDISGNTNRYGNKMKQQRKNRIRARSVNESFRLSQRKKQATDYKVWQANQIKIWHLNNEDLLRKENTLRKLSRVIDTREPELL